MRFISQLCSEAVPGDELLAELLGSCLLLSGFIIRTCVVFDIQSRNPQFYQLKSLHVLLMSSVPTSGLLLLFSQEVEKIE